MINKGRLFEYTKYGKRDKEDSPKRRSLTKTLDIETGGKEASSEEEEAYEGSSNIL